jgi:hypothetical protein
MRLRPALVLAAPAGVLGGHAIGYLLAPGPAGTAAVHHGYLALVLAVAVPLAAMAVGWSATVGSGRDGADSGVALGALLAAQWMLFAGQETVEHALAGHGAAAAFHSPALWCGLAAQVLTALVAVVVLRASAATGARLRALAGRFPPVALPVLPWRAAPPPGRPLPSLAAASPSRGPPAARFA